MTAGEKQEMKITILGSGTCVPSLERHPCSVLVKSGACNILIDAGPGTMGQLLSAGVQINDVDMILLSHFHLDHSAEIAPFIFATKYPGFTRQKKLRLIGGPGLKTLFSQLNAAYNNNLDMPQQMFELIELDKTGTMDFQPEKIQLTYTHVDHKPESLAYRLTDQAGFSMVYSGDTDYSDALIDLSASTDILICESALPDGQKVPGHLTPALAGKIATEAKVKKLVLTHFYPECDQADMKQQGQKAFQGPIILAEDLLTL